MTLVLFFTPAVMSCIIILFKIILNTSFLINLLVKYINSGTTGDSCCQESMARLRIRRLYMYIRNNMSWNDR